MFHSWNSADLPGDHVARSEERMDPFMELPNLPTSPKCLKRKISGEGDVQGDRKDAGTKRARIDIDVTTPPETPAMSRQEYFSPQAQPSKASFNTDRIVEIIERQFGTEILLKHKELRLINLELAKCEAALEQLRRCHLIPYPTTCPTPQQMLDIADGKIPAPQSKNGQSTPQWAPPYGVVDGPYARHYAKWLIPDPKFDGVIPESQGMLLASRSMTEGRSTRNSLSEGATIGKRVARGQTGQKPLPGVPQPKVKSPIIIKRARDGLSVKLVCNVCNREDFNSPQGFINHCRIAHRKEYKSHEEAAIHCGHPITAGEVVGPTSEEKPAAAPAPAPVPAPAPTPTIGTVHPLARPDATAEQNAYAMILGRIDKSLKLFHQGDLPGIANVPKLVSPSPAEVDGKSSKVFIGSSTTPFLSQMLQSRRFTGDLDAHVEDAKTKMESDTLMLDDDESDEGEQLVSSRTNGSIQSSASASGARFPAMRMPALAVPSTIAPDQRPSSSKGRSPHLSIASTVSKLPLVGTPGEDSLSEDESTLMDVDRSPNTATSVNAPSLVSDDGGDDSDDGSSSDASDADAMSDIAEVNIEFSDMQDPLAQHSGSTSNGSRVKKEETRHVTFVTPVAGKAAARRKPRV